MWAGLAIVTLLAAGCGKAGGAIPPVASSDHDAGTSTAAVRSPGEIEVAQLTALRKNGELANFVAAAIAASDGPPSHARVLVRTEALLASGRNSEAQRAALQAADLALQAGDTAIAEQALKCWGSARWRARQPWNSVDFAAMLERFPPDARGPSVVRFWRDAQRGQAAFQVESDDPSPGPVPLASSPAGSLPAELNAIEAQAGEATLPLVFIDTGAQHTLMTPAAAQSAGVRIGPGSARLVGFGGLDARPGLLDTLRIGNLTLRNVPVLVGNSAPLVALEGQMSLGTELMHHVRLTIDYPGRGVWAAPAVTTDDARLPPARWEIPLWTFPQAMLAEATLGDGRKARVLVDTGDRAGTFVSARWARRNLPGFHRSNTPIVFKFKRRDLLLELIELGNQTLVNWPVFDTMPNELERLDLVDVLVGHDALWPYRLTIDLPGRVLRLEGEAPRQAFAAGRPAADTVPASADTRVEQPSK